MSFVEDCIKECLPVWEKCMETPFLKQLSDGTLPEECFKGYIVDDSLYLREYAKVFAWGMLHSDDMEEIRIYYSLLSFVNEAEDSTRRYYVEKYGLSDEAIQKLPLRPQNQAYVNEMHNAAKNAPGPAECMMACLPCMLSYEWIFKKILNTSDAVLKSPYARFVEDYAGGRYDGLCAQWIAFADKWCENISDERRAEYRRIFHACSEHELHFWEMSEKPRTDL